MYWYPVFGFGQPVSLSMPSRIRLSVDRGSHYTSSLFEAWARAGVHCYTRPSDPNIYVIDGKSVLHTTALRHLRNYPAQK